MDYATLMTQNWAHLLLLLAFLLFSLGESEAEAVDSELQGLTLRVQVHHLPLEAFDTVLENLRKEPRV